ncbi:hypothetical protein JW905_06645 [bacterium]|nr:hypothetical protein [candidate division CSSED10-310 bacterium]
MKRLPVVGRKVRGTAAFLVKLAAFLYVALLGCPLKCFPILPGLDPSWGYTLHRFAGSEVKFGRDVVWTFGPLGWISAPMDMGETIRFGLIFQGAAWLSLCLLVIVPTTEAIHATGPVSKAFWINLVRCRLGRENQFMTGLAQPARNPLPNTPYTGSIFL